MYNQIKERILMKVVVKDRGYTPEPMSFGEYTTKMFGSCIKCMSMDIAKLNLDKALEIYQAYLKEFEEQNGYIYIVSDISDWDKRTIINEEDISWYKDRPEQFNIIGKIKLEDIGGI